MYKDPDKQKEANRERQRRYRERCVKGMVQGQGVTQTQAKGVTSEGVTGKALPDELDLKPNKIFKACEKRLRIPDHPASVIPKRGKDIKVFADLPVDVQETIVMMSRRDGKIDPIEKANRTARALDYSHRIAGQE